jgi:site-specific recombinase XerD
MNGAPIKRFDSAWNAICELAGFDDFHYHDLRYPFCSNPIMAGSDIKPAKGKIGHSDLSMTDRYSHLTLPHKKDCQDRLANHYARTEKITKP